MMKIIRSFFVLVTTLLVHSQAFAAATILPPPETCFQATAGIQGMVGVLGTITPGSGGIAGTYTNIALTGGLGTGATANITVSAGGVTAITIVNPGLNYSVNDVLSALSTNIGGTTGFSVPILSIAVSSGLVGGQIFTYIPNTSTPKTTWFNADQANTHQNTNPIKLDQNGCAIIYGAGAYRFVVQDSLGNTVYDQVTQDASSFTGVFWAGTAGGTPNAITVVDAGFNGTSGTIINFTAISTNTGTVTLNPSGFGNVPITQPSSTGPIALTAGQIIAGNTYSVVYSSGTNTFQLLAPPATASAAAITTVTPQGYLTLTNDLNNVIQTGDVIAATTVYYTPYVGSLVPIWNGSSFVLFSFNQLTLTLGGSFSGSTIYDICVFSNGGSPTLVGGPAWTSSSAGAGARGTGAGSAQIQKVNGIFVNSFQIAGLNGSNSYTIPAEQCTYLGSMLMDGSSGQVSNYVTAGQNRKWGLWNAYNRVPIIIQSNDSTANWNYTTNTWRVSRSNISNDLLIFSGLAEENYELQFTQLVQTAATGNLGGQIGIGFNSTTSPSGFIGSVIDNTNTVTVGASVTANLVEPGSLGQNVVYPLEQASTTSGTVTFFGNNAMIFKVKWRG